MRSLKFLLTVVLISATVFTFWPTDKDPESDTAYLVGRIWLERAPKSERDLMHYLGLVVDGNTRVGSLALASMWRLQAEHFRFDLKANRLHLRFIQEGSDLALKAKTYRCKVPEPFNLCLELTTPKGGVAKFYSHLDWTFKGDGQSLNGEPMLQDTVLQDTVPIDVRRLFAHAPVEAKNALASESSSATKPSGVRSMARQGKSEQAWSSIFPF